MSKIHFISGLPRSGSTLLAALLHQNHNFCAGMTSPLYQIFAAVLRNVSGHNELNCFITDRDREKLLKNTIENYFSDTTCVYFDTSRSWTTKTDILFDLFPNARMICCVRNPAWILDSFERIIRKNKYQLSKMFHFDPNINVYGRINSLAAPNGILGGAYNNLREAFFGTNSDKLMLIRYETLTRNPDFVLQAIYQFIGEEWQTTIHQYSDVTYSADDFDATLGTPGLHTISGPVRVFDPTRPTILPPDIFAAHKENDFWNNDKACSLSNAIVL